MSLHPIDLTIIGGYLGAIVALGFWLSRRAGRDIGSYFLSGNTVPWYVLGMSNASSMFDITGTMWLVSVIFVYGLKGVWVPWLWPLFNQVFLMIYLSVWVRRSGVLTGAEWMATRFGKRWKGELSRISVLVFALVSVIGFLSYAFQGIGKFATVFFPYDLAPQTYAAIFMGICAVYVVVGGMYSVIATDVLQFVILTVASLIVGWIAFTTVTPAELQAAVPGGWDELFFGWRLDVDWSTQLPAVTDRIAEDGWELFTIFFMMIAFKGMLVSAAGPTPSYDMQRILAARTPREAALMSGFVSVCTVPRWFLIAGTTVLGLVFFQSDLAAMGDGIDFEMMLPWVMNEFLPIGLTGLLLAGLLAAFMSTFDSTVNAGAAYLVNDVYKRYIHPEASQSWLIWVSYGASFLVVVVGITFGYLSESINSVTQWIVSGLYGGYAAPNMLKWHWWRFNGAGYFGGMMTGIVAALLFPVLAPDLSALDSFPFILMLSAVASVAGSLLTEPTDEETLKHFYKSVRPWGFWGPIHDKVVAGGPAFEGNRGFARDATNVVVGIAWQTALYLAPVALLVFDYETLAGAVAIVTVTSVILKKNWYDRLEPGEPATTADLSDDVERSARAAPRAVTAPPSNVKASGWQASLDV